MLITVGTSRHCPNELHVTIWFIGGPPQASELEASHREIPILRLVENFSELGEAAGKKISG
jgi:hypothetical protein